MIKLKRVRRRRLWGALIFVFVICGFFHNRVAESVCAKEETEQSAEEIPENIRACRDSIVHIESVCWDGDTQVYAAKAYTGFVVSDDTSGIYILTVYDGLFFGEEEKADIRAEYGLEDTVRISEKIEVVFHGDLRIPAEIAGESGQRNLALLKLGQEVRFETVLQFAEKNTLDKGQLFLLSYPEESGQGNTVFTPENVEITQGNLNGMYKSKDLIFLRHDIQAEKSSAGGPLLDQNGFVAGMFQSSCDQGQSGKAIGCESLKDFLDTYKVSYQVHYEETQEEKLPLVNIVLGAAIAIVLSILVLQRFASRRVREDAIKKGRRNTPAPAKKEAEGRPSAPGKRIEAGLEFPAEKRTVMICKSPFLIGREKDADFSLSENKKISRQHAAIEFDGENFCLSDLKSTNYTFLNGEKLKPGEKYGLKNGDEIVVWKVRVVFRIYDKSS